MLLAFTSFFFWVFSSLVTRPGNDVVEVPSALAVIRVLHQQLYLESAVLTSIASSLKRAIDQSAGGKLRDKNAEESWALLEDLALYDNESWNDPRDFAKLVKAISLPQDVLSTSDRRLIELKNQVQRLMEAHLAPKKPVQVNKISSSDEICSGPYDTRYCMKNPEPAFVDYASSRNDEAGGLVSNFMASQDARLSKFKADFKQQQSEMTNKIDTVLKAITDQITRALPSDTIKNPKLNINSNTSVLSARSYQMEDPQCSSQTHNLINAISNQHSEGDQYKGKTLMVNKVRTIKSKEPEHTLEDEFKDLHLNLMVLEVLVHAPIYNAILDKYVESLELGKNGSAFIQGFYVNIILLYLFKKLKTGLLEEIDHVFGLVDGTKSYPIRIVKDVEVYIGRLKLLNDFYVIDMKKDPKTPLLVERGFLATANAIIDCRKAKIVVGEGITRSVFGVKEIDPDGKEFTKTF
ncbi:MAK10-like protein [Tanacetum coccineum]|uniref:MAK10-like protein n=1 Tax=Tanacetum coccineum TaxID=301880 RepID=A0ABQ5HEV0_9ASTR